MLRFIDGLSIRINNRWHVSDWSNVIARTDRGGQLGLASKHALNQRRGFDEPIFTREARCLEHHVIHLESYLCSETIDRTPPRTSLGSKFPSHRILSDRAAFTSGLACSAPSTTTEAIVARASSGVTSAAIVARPNTLISSISPARRAASRSSRL